MFRRVISFVVIAFICLALLPNLISCRKNDHDESTWDDINDNICYDSVVWLPRKSLLDESEIPEEIKSHPDVPLGILWLAKINKKIIGYVNGILSVYTTSVFHGYGFRTAESHHFYCYNTETGEITDNGFIKNDDFITKEEAEQLFEIVKNSYESTT